MVMLAGTRIPSALSDDEIWSLQAECADRDVLELGAQFGASTIAIGRVARSVCTVDWFRGDPFVGPAETEAAFRANLARSGLSNVCLHVGRFEEVVPALHEGRQYDVAFLDGDHSAYFVERDLALLASVVRQDGTIICHDFGRFGVEQGVHQFLARHPRYRQRWGEGTLILLRDRKDS